MVLAFIFGDVGIGEWLVLLAVVLVVVGPKRLPETARKLGRWYSRVRRAADGFRRQLMELDQGVDDAARRTEAAVDRAFTSEGDEAKTLPPSEEPTQAG